MTRDTDDFFSDPFGTEGRHSSSSTFSRQSNSSSSSDGGFGFPRGFFDDARDSNASRSHFSTIRRTMEDDDGDSGRGKSYSKTVQIGRDVNPDDVKITLKDYVMTVDVKTAGKELMNRFTIPRNVDKSKLNSTWTADGNLKIEAPYLEEKQQQQQQQQQQSSQIRKVFDSDSTSDFFGSGIVEGSQNTPGKYSVNVPIGKNVDPQNLKVTVKDDVMTIEAKIEKKSEDGTATSKVSQEFKRSFTLPSNVITEQLTSTLTTDGCLKIEAPVMTQKKRQ